MHGPDAAYETLTLERPAPGLVLLSLNRPERANAMTETMFAELARVAAALDADADIRVLIITGAGRAFCAGYDLAEAQQLPDLGALGMLDLQERAARALLAIRSIRVPVIAAVNGAAAGGGLALALAADIRLACTEAKFSAAFVTIGLSAGDLGTSWLLTRLIGPAATSEICFTARTVHADEAGRLGLVNSVTAPDSLLADAQSMAESIGSNSPGGVRLSKRAIQHNQEIGSYAAALELENRGQALLSTTSDMSEALAAVTEKRSARFSGR